MKDVFADIRRYLMRPETGAGLLFVALALGIARTWAVYLVGSGEPLAGLFAADNPQQLFFFWTLVSFAIAAWLAFLLLRRRLSSAMRRRALLVAAIHAVAALRFYDWGLVLFSVLPLFALLPAVLLPQERDT